VDTVFKCGNLFFIQHGYKRKLNDRHHHANKKTRGNAIRTLYSIEAHGRKLTRGDIVVDRNVNQKIGDRSTDDEDDDDADTPEPRRSGRNRRQ